MTSPRVQKDLKKRKTNGWKTCSRGHHYRGTRCDKCWPGGKKKR